MGGNMRLLWQADCRTWSHVPWDHQSSLASPVPFHPSLQVRETHDSSQTVIPQLLAGYYSSTVVMYIQLEGCMHLLGTKTIVAFISGLLQSPEPGLQNYIHLPVKTRELKHLILCFEF